ncbi:MAG: hypothetical protein IPG90_13560 [Bacteroidetes bacterium]|nr:hypothetical protein [Bacteroidota bacterium]MBP6401714.1 hypothetical protein [Bacteroidia bacterium]MBK6839147.1 hypothetical protein [Bacteroidota bacterium]MBK9524441.1 hypothetical protein [Bacteroidota bacterium]MBK9543491.1 hypothetical protein [Bacteroidota bacterium]
MKNYLLKLLLVSAVFVFPACHPQKKIAGNYSYETECLGVEMDGTQSLKAFGTGSNNADAIEQAKKNAVRDVLFKGIRKGKPDCELRPVLTEVNALENHKSYFNIFFADGGPYKNYVNTKDGTGEQELIKDGNAKGAGVQFGVVVQVLRSALIKRMTDDNILNNK